MVVGLRPIYSKFVKTSDILRLSKAPSAFSCRGRCCALAAEGSCAAMSFPNRMNCSVSYTAVPCNS